MSLPYHENGYVYFELRSSQVAVFDPANKPGIYEIPVATPGSWRLPVDAIRPATQAEIEADSKQLISVDAAQIFLIDASCLDVFLDEFDSVRGSWPDYDYFDGLRETLRIDFGYLVAGGELTAHFDGDGTWMIDVTQFEHVDTVVDQAEKTVDQGTRELMLKVARTMKTFVCTQCFSEELLCESEPDVCVQQALDAGWLVTTVPSQFGKFSVLCPTCRADSGERA